MLSNHEAHLLGDVRDEIDKAFAFVDGLSESSFSKDELRAYAVEKAIQNTAEACIQLSGKKDSGRFEQLFPQFELADIRSMGNRVRHDYGNINRTEIWNTLHDILPDLQSRAVELLVAYRRLHGQED